MDLNKIRGQRPSSDAEGSRATINCLSASAYKKSEDASSQARDKCFQFQEDTESEDHLPRSRIPASQKGKAVQGAESTHDDQATANGAQANSSMAAVKTAPSDFPDPQSTRLQHHQMSIQISEEGWEPAKLHPRKRPDTKSRTVQISDLPRDKSMGSVFFRSKMEGRCFNCFSPKSSCPLLPFLPSMLEMLPFWA